MSTEVTFRIVDSWNPDTIPMDRLGRYLVELAALYGEPAAVHFRALRKGSTAVVSRVDDHAVPAVVGRIATVRRFDAPVEARTAYDRIDAMLAEDNARGSVRLKGKQLAAEFTTGNVIVFPGRNRDKLVDLGPIRRTGFLDGELVRIGGKDKTVHLLLQDGEISHGGIITDRSMARQLAPLIFGPTLRLWGTGTWRRDPEGIWAVESFRVGRFEVLKTDEDLSAVLEEVRELGGSEWHREQDPVAALLRERNSDEGQAS